MEPWSWCLHLLVVFGTIDGRLCWELEWFQILLTLRLYWFKNHFWILSVRSETLSTATNYFVGLYIVIEVTKKFCFFFSPQKRAYWALIFLLILNLNNALFTVIYEIDLQSFAVQL